jgi:putative colanic acid biosynthesis UDP-glucose lipid carrier transferase
MIANRLNYFFWKRATDVAFSLLILLLVYSWLLPLLALLVRLDSKGPIFFRQQRVGYLGRLFICIKFRTMVVNPLADVCQAVPGDPRVTRAGAWLRRTGLDELPQLLNVLKGDMSLIGPRPHMIRDNEVFMSVVRDYDVRHTVRPGITGIAQVRGYRGLTASEESIFRRYRWDVFYVRYSSPALDARIFWDTVRMTGRLLLGDFAGSAGE